MSYPRNAPYTLAELDKEPEGKFLDKFLGNIYKQWKSKLSEETIKQIESGKRINDYEFNQMRGNSHDWKTRYPLLDDEALIKRVQYTLDNCGINEKGRYTPNTTYEEALYNSLVPLLMDRLEEANAELHKVKKDAKEAVNTSWRVVDNIPQTKESKEWPFAGFVKSAIHHLKNIDYIFNDEENKES